MNLAHGFAEQGIKVDLVLINAVGAYLREVSPDVRVVVLRKK